MTLPKKFKFIGTSGCTYIAIATNKGSTYEIKNDCGLKLATWSSKHFIKVLEQFNSWKITEVLEDNPVNDTPRPDTLFNIDDL